LPSTKQTKNESPYCYSTIINDFLVNASLLLKLLPKSVNSLAAMESTDIEPDSRFAKLCSYCSSLIHSLDDPLRQIEQGKRWVTVKDPLGFRSWVAAAENGCGMCSAFLDSLRSADGEVISASSSKRWKPISKWPKSALRLEYPDDFSRRPEGQNKIILLERQFSTNDGLFASQTLITERESSRHQ